MRVKNWDYRELRERIADGITLRAFTDFYCEKVPKHDAFNRGFNRLTPATLKAINDLVVEAAVKLGLEDGSKLRVDTRNKPSQQTCRRDDCDSGERRWLVRSFLVARLAESKAQPRAAGVHTFSAKDWLIELAIVTSLVAPMPG